MSSLQGDEDKSSKTHGACPRVGKRKSCQSKSTLQPEEDVCTVRRKET